MPRRMSLRFFRWAAVLLATVGLALLYAMVRFREVPLVRVDDIAATMNFATVRIAGRVEGDARVFRSVARVEGLRFLVDDGTGTIGVRVRAAHAERLVDESRVPRDGDRVELAGSLQVTPESVSMWLQDVTTLTLEREEDPLVPLADLAGLDEGSMVEVEGEVLRVRPPPEGSRAPWQVVLQDASGVAVPVVFWEDVAERLTGRMPGPGATVRVRARRDAYRGAPQLRLLRAEDLRLANGASGP